MITLRPYQQECLDATMQALVQYENVLIQAATGAGKTIFFSALVRSLMKRYPDMRIGIVAHREILVRQAYDKLLKVWPEGRLKVGLACASIAERINLNAPVIIGSPQTLARRAESMAPLNFLIVDEAHRIPPQNAESQYGKMITALRKSDARMRLLGVTATPYRLQHGYIYGTRCKKGAKNWFDTLAYQVNIETLQDQGYLVPLRSFGIASPNLTKIKKSAGEYKLSELSGEMSKALHVDSAVKAVQDYAADRRHIVVFGVTIAHAETLCAAFLKAGFRAGVAHSEMPKTERRQTLAAFDAGSLDVICNVGVLTEGWDCTCVDCMVMCRPTMSPALYIQMIGRGLRTHEGKENCFLLDLSGNWQRHGMDINNPQVNIPQEGDKKKEEPQFRGRICPQCLLLMDKPQKVCPHCGYEFPPPEREVVHKRQKMMEYTNIATSKPLRVSVTGWQARPYTSRAGNYMLKIALTCSLNGSLPIQVNHFLDVEGTTSFYGKMKAMDVWHALSYYPARKTPKSVAEAVERLSELRIPDAVTIKKKDRFYNVVKWE